MPAAVQPQAAAERHQRGGRHARGTDDIDTRHWTQMVGVARRRAHAGAGGMHTGPTPAALAPSRQRGHRPRGRRGPGVSARRRDLPSLDPGRGARQGDHRRDPTARGRRR